MKVKIKTGAEIEFNAEEPKSLFELMISDILIPKYKDNKDWNLTLNIIIEEMTRLLSEHRNQQADAHHQEKSDYQAMIFFMFMQPAPKLAENSCVQQGYPQHCEWPLRPSRYASPRAPQSLSYYDQVPAERHLQHR